MPYVPDPEVKWDLFLSYAHVDNPEGWVERFHKQLSIKLDQRGGRAGEIQIWRDSKLDEATIFDAVIQDPRRALRAVPGAVLERLQAVGLLQGRVRRLPPALRRRPAARGRPLADRPGAPPQHPLRAAAGNVRSDRRLRLLRRGLRTTRSARCSRPTRRSSATTIDRPRTVIIKILNGLRETTQPAAPAPACSTRSVFLAAVCDSQRKARERLAADLGPRGLTVATRTPPPFPAAEHESAARSALAGSKLVVHLFDAWSDDPMQGRDGPDLRPGAVPPRAGAEAAAAHLDLAARPLGSRRRTSLRDVDWLSVLNGSTARSARKTSTRSCAARRASSPSLSRRGSPSRRRAPRRPPTRPRCCSTRTSATTWSPSTCARRS